MIVIIIFVLVCAVYAFLPQMVWVATPLCIAVSILYFLLKNSNSNSKKKSDKDERDEYFEFELWDEDDKR